MSNKKKKNPYKCGDPGGKEVFTVYSSGMMVNIGDKKHQTI